MVDNNKKTPLYEEHLEDGAQIIEYHKFLMPLQYDSIISEHQNVRKNAGLFDISHMGEIIVEGKGATDLVQNVITNDVSKIPNYKALYTPICNTEGGIVDDVIVYKYNPEKYMLVVNCANIKKDFAWINVHKTNDTDIENLSDQIALIAIQGPKSEDIITQAFGDECKSLSRFQFIEITNNKMELTVSRTGYTGEDGFEIFVNPSQCVDLWNILLVKYQKMGLKPAGLGARNTLRIEAGYLLYGNDINESTTPLEANIGWTVKFDKAGFTGKDSLLRQKEQGSKSKLIAFKMFDKGIPRANYEIAHDVHINNIIGKVTSGTFSPVLQVGIGLGYVDALYTGPKRKINIIIRNNNYPATIVNTRFIQKLRKGTK